MEAKTSKEEKLTPEYFSLLKKKRKYSPTDHLECDKEFLLDKRNDKKPLQKKSTSEPICITIKILKVAEHTKKTELKKVKEDKGFKPLCNENTSLKNEKKEQKNNKEKVKSEKKREKEKEKKFVDIPLTNFFTKASSANAV